MSLADLPTLAEMSARRPRAMPKGATPSRLQAKTAKAVDEGQAERRWRKDVWTRDKGCCRWCRRKVVKTIELIPEAGQCHHVSGRIVKAIRWDRRNGALFCKACHERLTGKVAEKFLIASTKTYTVEGVSYINADKPFKYVKVA